MNETLEKIIHAGAQGVNRALFLTPVMMASETISGMSGSQSLKSRAIATGVQLIVAYPYQEYFRPAVYRMMGVNEQSSALDKNIANKISFALHQIPLYTAILYAAGASAEQIAVALPTGVAVGIGIAKPFQEFMDKTSEFIKNKSRELNKLKELGWSYAKNFAYATAIAIAVRYPVSEFTSSIADQWKHPDKYAYVYDPTWAPDGAFYTIKKENMIPGRHFPVSNDP